MKEIKKCKHEWVEEHYTKYRCINCGHSNQDERPHRSWDEEAQSINIIIDDKDAQNPIFIEVEDSHGKSLSVESYGKELRKDGYRVIQINKPPEKKDLIVVFVLCHVMVTSSRG